MFFIQDINSELLLYSECLFQKASRELDGVKEGMEEVVKMETEIAEFFCEDATSFKLEECFKSLWGFCVKFRKVGNSLHGKFRIFIFILNKHHFFSFIFFFSSTSPLHSSDDSRVQS